MSADQQREPTNDGLQDGEQQGSHYDMSGDFRRSIVNIGSTLTGVTQKIINNPTYILQETPPLWADVPPMPPYFLGRDTLVEGLVEQLTGGQSMALSAEGLPGVGKTALATALAHHKDVLAHFSDGVLWAGLGPKGDVMRALGEWAAVLGLDESELVEVEQRRRAVQQAIGQRKLLLVIDDAWELEAAQAMQCGGPNCVHLLTSRDKGLARQFAGSRHILSVPTLEDDPAFALLQEIAPKACAADPETAQQLAEAVGGLPLALELLGGYLATPESSVFPVLQSKALSEMSDPKRRLQLAAARLGGTGEKVALQDTIALSLDGLREIEGGKEAVAAFYSLGAFAPKPETFSLDAAKAVAGCDEAVLVLLVARNLVEVQGEQGEWLVLHQVLADVARAKAAQTPAIRSWVTRLIWLQFASRKKSVSEIASRRHREYYLALVNEDREDWRRIGAAYGQIKWAWERLQPEAVLDFVWALQIYQRRQGLWTDGLEWAETGLARVRAKGNRKVEGALLNNIGEVYRSLGQGERALDYFNRALPIREEVGDRAGVAHTLNNIGEVYHSLGQWERALDYFNRALPIREEVGDRAGVAYTLNNIGEVYHSLGQWERALDYYHRALVIREEVGDRAGIATTLNNTGGVYHKLGQWERALDYYHRALPISEEVGDRAGVAHTLNNIGGVYHGLGQGERALDYFNRALPIMEEVGHQAGLAVTLNNIGVVYRSLSQGERALDYYHRALPISEEVGDRAGVAQTLNNIGEVYRSLGQGERALDYYHRALPIGEEVGDRYGESVTRYNLAMVYRGQGQLVEAVAELERVVEIDQLVQHPNLEDDMAMLAEVRAELAAQQQNDG
jgi:tetratricopeptide (TPR) repeat protein